MIENELFQQFVLGAKTTASTNNKRTVIYSRVSSKGQEDNTSLVNQREACLKLVEREGLQVIEEFGGKGESAKAGSARLEYEQMLKFVRNRKNDIRYVVFYAYDRFSREGGKAIVTKEQLKQLGIIVKSATMPIDTSNPLGEGMEDMQLVFAKMENDVRRKRCIDGMKAKLKDGHWCGPAPVGYQWINGKIVLEPKKAALIKKAFKWKHECPSISFQEIKRRLKKLGLDLPNSTMTRMMRNPFYCGIIVNKALEGEFVEGNHQPIISKTVFLEVNQIVKKTNIQGWRVDEANDRLPLKRFMKCECCGRPLTGFVNKKVGGKLRENPLSYYKCPTRTCKINLRAKSLNEVFFEHLKQYSIDLELVPLIVHEFKVHLVELNSASFKEAEIIEQRIKQLDKKLVRLRERYVVEESITQEDYIEFGEKFRQEKQSLSNEFENLTAKSSNLLNRIEETILISAQLGQIWRNGNYREKQRVQKMVFPDGMCYSKEKDTVLTPRPNEAIRVFSELSNLFSLKNDSSKPANSSGFRLVKQTEIHFLQS